MCRPRSKLYNPEQPSKVLAIINRLTTTGEINDLVRSGIISYKVLLHRDIYYYYDILRRNGYSVTDATYACCEKFKCSELTVYRARKCFGS